MKVEEQADEDSDGSDDGKQNIHFSFAIDCHISNICRTTSVVFPMPFEERRRFLIC